jgi:hypothetical protein
MREIEVYDAAGDRLLTAESVADLAGIKVVTLDAYVSRGQMPAPLATVGLTRLWLEPTVKRWLATRGRDLIPVELRALRRWMRHEDKRPLAVNGRAGSSTDPSTWSTYAAARASSVGDGLGFVLNGDGIVGLDLDHCVTRGVLSPSVLAILEALPDTYAELSPSGYGVRLFCRADVARGRRFISHGVALEVSGTGRFLTVTGNRIPGRPSVLANLDAAVRGLMPA